MLRSALLLCATLLLVACGTEPTKFGWVDWTPPEATIDIGLQPGSPDEGSGDPADGEGSGEGSGTASDAEGGTDTAADTGAEADAEAGDDQPNDDEPGSDDAPAPGER